MSLALYRRYRPESFDDVVGQEHVTEPLMQALRTGRVNHAYLFSGPRGCGKTTSARILARCLNCEQGPTPTPCGTCASCRDLARGGPGSLDVIEIDAASHGGVDDARDLRERVAMSPVRDRYRVYIIDEAHMVSTQGFNAMLKVVEEPPEHVKFVFATTEPDKVLQTIRSRTHHYAFRLVPPDVLAAYLATVCETEGVPVGQGVLPLVVRAGQGSVRDSLSVLDQLIAGASEAGLDYARAVALLGYTDEALLDDVVDALAQVDGAALFAVVNRVVESGHDPRRFVDDLLERLRDLILVQAMGPAADGVLRAVPSDQLARMRSQASLMGPAELSRAADVTNTALAEMVGASSPRMHLELLCARLLLPAADDSGRGLTPRLERLERRLGDGPMPASVGAVAQSRPASGPVRESAPVESASDVPRLEAAEAVQPAEVVRAAGGRDQGSGGPGRAAGGRSVESQGAEGRSTERQAAAGQGAGRQGAGATAPADRATSAAAQSDPSPPVQGPGAGSQAAPGGIDTERMRRSWTELLGLIEKRRRATWMILSNAGVHELADGVLRLSFVNQGTAKGFANGQHPAVVADAVRELFNLSVRVEPYTGPTGPARARRPAGSTSAAPPSAVPTSTASSPAAPVQTASASAPAAQPSGPAPRASSPGPEQPEPEQPEPERPEPERPEPERSTPEQPGPEPASLERPKAEQAVTGPSARPISTEDAWGAPFADEPPLDEPPPDEPPGPPARVASRPPGGSRAAAPQDDRAQGSNNADNNNAGNSTAGNKTAGNSAGEPSKSADDVASNEAGGAPQASAPGGNSTPSATASGRSGSTRRAPGKAGSGGAGTAEGKAKPAQRPTSRYEQLRQAQPEGPSGGRPAILDEPSADDPDAEDSGQVGAAVVERLLGGKVIDIQEGR